MRMLLRDTLLRSLVGEDAVARYGAADAAVCAIPCCGCCCVRMLLRDTLLRTLRYENVADTLLCGDAAA